MSSIKQIAHGLLSIYLSQESYFRDPNDSLEEQLLTAHDRQPQQFLSDRQHHNENTTSLIS